MKEKNAEKLCMFQKSCTFAPSKQKDDNRSLILGYGVMVTQQILVLFFLVRVRVAQQKEGVSKCIPSFFYDKAPTFPSRGFVIT